MTIRTLQTHPTTGELLLSGGNLATLAPSGDSIVQAARSYLRTFLGEWFLDDADSPQIGVPYFDQVLVKNPDPNTLRSVFRKALLDVPGIATVVSIDMKLVTATRQLLVDWRATTDTGELVQDATQLPLT